MNEEFLVLSKKSTKYLNDAVIVSRISHWNVRGSEFYQCHLLFERVYNEVAELIDTHIEKLRACGYNPDFPEFSGPGIEMTEYDCRSLVELTLDYVMAANGALGMFFRFAVEHDHDPRLVGLSDHLGSASSTLLTTQYLLQAYLGY